MSTDDTEGRLINFPVAGDVLNRPPELPDPGRLFPPVREETETPPESPEETTMELPAIPRPMAPEMALRSEGFSTPDIDGESDEGGEGEYVHRRSLAERLGDWLEYRIALGHARIESEAPFREAEIARKVELLNAKTAREVGLLEQHNKLREAQLKARADKTAARGKGDAAGAKGGGGKGASGLGGDKGGRKSGPQGPAPRQQPKSQQPTKSPAPMPKQQKQTPPPKPTQKQTPKPTPPLKQLPQKQSPAPRDQSRKGPAPKDQSKSAPAPKEQPRKTPPKQLPQKQSPAPKEQSRRDDKSRPKVDLSKGKGGGTKSPGSSSDGKGSKGSGSGGKTPPLLGSDGAKGGPKAGPGAKGRGSGSKGADGASGGPDGKGAERSKGSSAGTGPRRRQAPKEGPERPTEGPKSAPGPQGPGGASKAPGGAAGGSAASGPGTPKSGSGPGPGDASADGPGWPGNRTVTPEWPGHETRKPPPAGGQDDYPDAVIVEPSALPPAPEPHTARPGTTRPTAQEDPLASEVTKPPSAQAGMAAKHRTDITFGEYLTEIVNIAIASGADKDRAQELAVSLGKVADALRDMAADLVGDHNITTEVVNQITDLADAASRMKALAERCATECEIASEAALLAATAVGWTYSADIQAMDDAGLSNASSAAHHD